MHGEWLDHLQQEYLATFVRDGGASVKFVVGDAQQRADLQHQLASAAEEAGYLVLAASAVQHRFHMPQDIFFAIARQVDWRATARRFILKLAEAEGFRAEGVQASQEEVFQSIAACNETDVSFLFTSLKPQFQRHVFYDRNMCKDFRIAMSHLCLLERSQDMPYPGQPIIDWLTGTNTRMSNVKPFSIYNPINRTTARHLLRSAVYWLHAVGYAGTVLLLDNSRVTERKRRDDGSRYYTRAMTIDHYELLREFIDSIDRFTATLIVACSDAAFLDQEPDRQSRGLGIYPALQTRIIDDVRDKKIQNPAAALYRLA